MSDLAHQRLRVLGHLELFEPVRDLLHQPLQYLRRSVAGKNLVFQIAVEETGIIIEFRSAVDAMRIVRPTSARLTFSYSHHSKLAFVHFASLAHV